MLMATPLSYTHCSHSQQVLDQSDHTKSYVVPWMLWSFSVVRIFFFFLEWCLFLLQWLLSDPWSPHWDFKAIFALQLQDSRSELGNLFHGSTAHRTLAFTPLYSLCLYFSSSSNLLSIIGKSMNLGVRKIWAKFQLSFLTAFLGQLSNPLNMFPNFYNGNSNTYITSGDYLR